MFLTFLVLLGLGEKGGGKGLNKIRKIRLTGPRRTIIVYPELEKN